MGARQSGVHFNTNSGQDPRYRRHNTSKQSEPEKVSKSQQTEGSLIESANVPFLNKFPLTMGDGAKTTSNQDAIRFSGQEIIYGDFNSKIYDGLYRGVRVYIKKIPCVFQDTLSVEEDVNTLCNIGNHKNILKYFVGRHIKHHRQVMLVSEMWYMSLEDAVLGEKFIQSTLDLIRQTVQGVEYLHSRDVVHGYLKPSNILISQGDHSVKLSDFGMRNINSERIRRYLDSDVDIGIIDFMAPEIISSPWKDTLFMQQSWKSDIYSLGCILYFTLSNGHHPFGAVMQRSYNIHRSLLRLDLERLIEAENQFLPLIKTMILRDNVNRPKASALLCQPQFWLSSQKVGFLRGLQSLGQSDRHVFNRPDQAVRGSDIQFWSEQLYPGFIHFLKKNYIACDNNLYSLVTAILYAYDNFSKLPHEIVIQLGGTDCREVVLSYFHNKFPLLFLVLWEALRDFKNCAESKKYYTNSNICSYSEFLREKFPSWQESTKANDTENSSYVDVQTNLPNIGFDLSAVVPLLLITGRKKELHELRQLQISLATNASRYLTLEKDLAWEMCSEYDMIFDLLKEWKLKNGENATLENLSRKLQHIGWLAERDALLTELKQNKSEANFVVGNS